MTLSNNDLIFICNYVESTRPSKPQGVMTYMDWIEESNEEYLRELKRKNRELAIDAIVDGKVDEFKNREPFLNPLDNQGHMATISPKLMSINVQGKTYLDLTDIYTDVMNTLELLTSNSMTIPQNLNITYQKDSNLTDSENEMAKSRRIMTRIAMVSNLIASSSRMGLANTIIAGLDVYEYLLMSNAMLVSQKGVVTGNINGMNVISSPYIKSNKVIMMKNTQKTENGLNVINCPNDMRYFLKETPNFEKCINWFEVN